MTSLRSKTCNQEVLLSIVLPHGKLLRTRKVYKYALTVVDFTRRYNEAEPLTSKDSAEFAAAFETIYKRGPLTWPRMLEVDPGSECV